MKVHSKSFGNALARRLNELDVPDSPEIEVILTQFIAAKGGLTLVVRHHNDGIGMYLCRFHFTKLDNPEIP